MSFEFGSDTVPIRPDIVEAFRREWTRLASSGTWWTGSQRVAIAATARAAGSAVARPSDHLPSQAVEAAELLAVRPGSAQEEWVAGVADAIGYPHYVELVGVVARFRAVDSFHRALGLDPEPLPEPVPGAPTRQEEPRAARGPGWVPMISGASVVHALTLVPDEAAAQEDMHGPLYLTYDGMGDLHFVRGLMRPQMELVAARTSVVNLCFY